MKNAAAGGLRNRYTSLLRRISAGRGDFLRRQFPFSLYRNPARSPRARAWIARCTGAICMSALTGCEFRSDS